MAWRCSSLSESSWRRLTAFEPWPLGRATVARRSRVVNTGGAARQVPYRREDMHGQRRVRPRATHQPDHTGHGLRGVDRRRASGHRHRASSRPRPPGRAGGADQPRGVLRVHAGAAQGPAPARGQPRHLLAAERVPGLGSAGWTRRPAPVPGSGAASALADLHEGVPRRGPALRGEADRLGRGAPGRRAPYAPGAGHGPRQRSGRALGTRSVGHLSTADLRRPDRDLDDRPGRGGAPWDASRRVHGAGAPLSTGYREPGGHRESGDLRGPPAEPEPGHVPLRRGRPRLSRPVRPGGGAGPRDPGARAEAGAGVRRVDGRGAAAAPRRRARHGQAHAGARGLLAKAAGPRRQRVGRTWGGITMSEPRGVDRRAFLRAAGVAGTVVLIGAALPARVAWAAALTKEQRDRLTPDEIIQLMKTGNERFRRGQRPTQDYLAQQRASTKGQYPAAVLLSCIDSRAPAETIMDLGIGDVFNARVAGNVANDDIIGSME